MIMMTTSMTPDNRKIIMSTAMMIMMTTLMIMTLEVLIMITT